MSLKKNARILLYIALLPVIGCMLLQAAIYFYFNKKLETYLQSQVTSVSHNTYKLSLDAVRMNIINQSVILRNIKLTPIGTCDSCNKAQYSASANEIKLGGISILPYFKDKSVIAQNIEFNNLSITIFQGIAQQKKTSPDSIKNNFSIYRLLGPKFTSLAIKTIQIKNAKINVFKNDDRTTAVFSSKENFINVKNFTLNNTVERLNRLFLADTFNVKMKTFSYRLGKNLYTMIGKNLSSSYSDSLLTIDSLQLIPNYKKTDFGKIVGYQVSRVKITSSQVRFLKMNVKLFFEHNWFIAEKLFLDEFSVNVYRDKNIPFKKIVRPSIQELVRKIPFFISIDSINIRNGNVVYEELAEKANKSGTITFNKLNATIAGLQNDTTLYSENSILRFKVSCLFMNKGELKAVYQFPLLHHKEVFSCSGELHSMQLAEMNTLLENSAHISIKSGVVDSLVFNFKANEFASAGTMKFLYHDLEIEFLNKEEEEIRLKKQLLSFLVKKFIIIPKNPEIGKPIRVTNIYFKRDPYRFFFYYSWKSLLSGIKPTLGVPKDFEFKKQ